MADIKFGLQCWQEQAGSENAKINIFVDGTQVVTEAEITATSSASPQVVSWEVANAVTWASGTTYTPDIKVILANDYYVDASTDRNVVISGLGHLTKHGDETDYAKNTNWDGSSFTDSTKTTITDFSDLNNFYLHVPTAVTGDQIESDWWSGRGTTDFTYIYVWGNADDATAGVTMSFSFN